MKTLPCFSLISPCTRFNFTSLPLTLTTLPSYPPTLLFLTPSCPCPNLSLPSYPPTLLFLTPSCPCPNLSLPSYPPPSPYPTQCTCTSLCSCPSCSCPILTSPHLPSPFYPIHPLLLLSSHTLLPHPTPICLAFFVSILIYSSIIILNRQPSLPMIQQLSHFPLKPHLKDKFMI